MPEAAVFEVSRQDLSRTRVINLPPQPPSGSIRLAVERFALTANTVTYAVAGDALGYWDFFPSDDPAWGRVPAMGWARVLSSGDPAIAVGTRCYGWFPMATVVDFQAVATADGFRDDGEHRARHAPVYRSYTATDRDPLHAPGSDAEDRHALLRGLLQTAFLADDFLAEQDWFAARRLLLLSASSKTAIALAGLAAARDGLHVTGLTSVANRGFVQGLGCYDEVLAYDELPALDPGPSTVIVDMAGNGALLADLHARLGDALKHSMAIGRSHHDAPPQPVGGAVRPQFFFAPAQGKKRVEQWGAAGYLSRVGQALARCVDDSRRWLELEHHVGAASVAAAWQETLAGRVAPHRGLICTLGADG